MANQVGPDTVSETGPQSGQFAGPEPAAAPTSGTVAAGAPAGEAAVGAHGASQAHASFHGRPVSWVAVTLITAGFLLGGLCLVFGPIWAGFWAGVGLTVIGGLLALATDIFEDWY